MQWHPQLQGALAEKWAAFLDKPTLRQGQPDDAFVSTVCRMQPEGAVSLGGRAAHALSLGFASSPPLPFPGFLPCSWSLPFPGFLPCSWSFGTLRLQPASGQVEGQGLKTC